MNILFYQPIVTNNSKTLLKNLGGTIDYNDIFEVHCSIKCFLNSLKKLKKDPSIAILLAPTKNDLLNLLSLKQYLENMRSILVLPDHKKETIAKGLILKPRYLTFIDDDLSNVVDVFTKMLGNLRYGAEK